jgi:hypothetical protein
MVGCSRNVERRKIGLPRHAVHHRVMGEIAEWMAKRPKLTVQQRDDARLAAVRLSYIQVKSIGLPLPASPESR